MSRCPRCGTPVEATGDGEKQFPDDPTIFHSGNAPQSPQNAPQSQLAANNREYISHPQNINPTTNSNAPFSTQTPPYQPAGPYSHPGTSQPGFPAGNQNTYPSQGGSYPGYPTASNTDYPGGTLPGLPSTLRKKSSSGLILALTALLLVIVLAIGLLIVGSGRIRALLNSNPGGPVATVTVPSQTTQPSPAGSTITPEQHARSVLERYYNNINNKNYRGAYNLWINNPQSYNEFVSGFARTKSDKISFVKFVRQGDGTLKVYLTIIATTDTNQQNRYQGYYIVGQQPDTTWKISDASITAG